MANMETRRAGARDSQRLHNAVRPRKRRVGEVLMCGCCGVGGVVVAAGLLRALYLAPLAVVWLSQTTGKGVRSCFAASK